MPSARHRRPSPQGKGRGDAGLTRGPAPPDVPDPMRLPPEGLDEPGRLTDLLSLDGSHRPSEQRIVESRPRFARFNSLPNAAVPACCHPTRAERQSESRNGRPLIATTERIASYERVSVSVVQRAQVKRRHPLLHPPREGSAEGCEAGGGPGEGGDLNGDGPVAVLFQDEPLLSGLGMTRRTRGAARIW